MPTIFEALEGIPIGTVAQVHDICDQVAKMTGSKPDSVRKELQKFTPGYAIYIGPMLYQTIGKARVRRSSIASAALTANAANEPAGAAAAAVGERSGNEGAAVAGSGTAGSPIDHTVPLRMPVLSDEASGSQRDWLEAQRIGRLGERLINRYFERRRAEKKIRNFRWVSKDKPAAAADFWCAPDNESDEWAEVKATGDKFEKTIFVSRAELELAVRGKPYRIYRAYEIGDQGGKARVSTNFEALAQAILDGLAAAGLPAGVTVSSVRIDPTKAGVSFGPKIRLAPLKAADKS
jgi:hypothetical protein